MSDSKKRRRHADYAEQMSQGPFLADDNVVLQPGQSVRSGQARLVDGVSEQRIAELVAEAEAGYDPEQLQARPVRHPKRRPDSTAGVLVELVPGAAEGVTGIVVTPLGPDPMSTGEIMVALQQATALVELRKESADRHRPAREPDPVVPRAALADGGVHRRPAGPDTQQMVDGVSIERTSQLIQEAEAGTLDSADIDSSGGRVFEVNWSAEDDEFVATVHEFPSLSFLAPTRDEAHAGLRALVALVELDLNSEDRP